MWTLMQLHVVKGTDSSRDEFFFVHGRRSISLGTNLMIVGNAKFVNSTIFSLPISGNFG